MNFNKIMRKILGSEGEKNIGKNGDLNIDPVPYSERSGFILPWRIQLFI